jgi:Protein of unknown function (DUF1622)
MRWRTSSEGLRSPGSWCSSSVRFSLSRGSWPKLFRRRPLEAYKGVRLGVGRAILLGLEILIIADIVQTITIDPTLESTIALGVVVLVRTFLSFSIEIELEGVVPWRRSSAKPGRSG